MADNLTDVFVGADVTFPTHDISLTDIDGKKAGLILCNRQGFKDPTQLRMAAMPRTPMQMSQGSRGYDDMELPFVAEVQTTMAGGRGNETLSSDRTKFFDSYRIDTTKEYPICAPAVIAQTGLGAATDSIKTNIDLGLNAGINTWSVLLKYALPNGTIISGVTLRNVLIDMNHSDLDNVTVYYEPFVADAPSASVYGTDDATYGKYSTVVNRSPYDSYDLTLTFPGVTIEAGYLWLLVRIAPTLDIGSIMFLGATTNGDVYINVPGSNEWTLSDADQYPDSIIHIIPEVDTKVFEYKRQLYAVMNATSKDSATLWMNGWRGVADSNSTALGTLVDATQTGWEVVQGTYPNGRAAGCIVLIINGKGENEEQPWRRVVSSVDGTLRVSTPWKIAHDTTTEYVVLGSDQWFPITTTRGDPGVNYLPQAVTSVAVVGNERGGSFVTFAFGQGTSDTVLSYYTVYRTGDAPNGVFGDTFSKDTAAKADLLCPIVNEQGKLLLWRADFDDCTVDYATLPPAGVPTTLNFDINAEIRADLTLQRDRLYYSLWEDITNTNNDNLLTLTRTRDNLKVEATRLVGSAGNPTSAAANSLLADAIVRHTNATESKLATARVAEDLRLEAYRIIGTDGTIAVPTTYIYYDGSPDVTHDSLLKTANTSGTDAEKIELTNRIYQLIGDGTVADPGVVTLVGTTKVDSLLEKADDDAAAASALYDIADSEVIELTNRAIDILGATGTISSPGDISTGIAGELSRVLTDITAEQNRIVLAGGVSSDLMRQILDLTYQIGVNGAAVATESEDSAYSAIDFPAPAGELAAHTDNVSSVAHRYLPKNIRCGSTSSRITNIIPYSTPVIPYIMKEDSFGSISDNIYQEIPLAELKAVRAEENGKTAMHYGVYLYFNLEGGRLERYYDQRIDDIGFNRDEGLPAERQGEVSKLVPYPGRFYAACNAGFSGYSTVMCHNGMGWHEIYRSKTSGFRITDLCIQAIPGNEYADRLWISEGRTLFALPIAITPIQQYRYDYFGYGVTNDDDGYVETSWIDFELKDVNKYFHSITIFSDYTGTINKLTEYDIDVWFKVDDSHAWTYAGSTGAHPNSELELRYPNNGHTAVHNVSGKKIKFKIYLRPNEQYYTPRLKAIVVNGVLRMPVKQSWNATFLLEPMSDLRKKTVTNKTYNSISNVDDTLYKRLQTWANSKTHATPLLMRTNDLISDNHYVFIDPMSIQTSTVQQIMGSGSSEKEYKHIASITLYEV